LTKRSVHVMLGAMTVDGAELVLVELREVEGGVVGVLTLNRPEHRNPMDRAMIATLNRCLDDLLARPEVRAVVLTGAAPAFSAGGDLRGYLGLYRDPDGFRTFLEEIRNLFDRLESSRLVSIAAVNGACVAGGFEMALACDLIVVGRSARIGDAHLKFWQLPGGGGSQRLPRAVGLAAAKRLFLMAELLTADEAYAMGLASAVYEDDELLDRAVALAERVTQTPEDTITTLKGLLAVADTQPLEDGLAHEIDTVVGYTTVEDGSAYRGLGRFLGGPTGR
jgi:enoyl-CoA hydratase/carnithine racemase